MGGGRVPGGGGGGLLCWNVRLPRAHGAGAEQAPPRSGAPGGGGGQDGRARAGGLNILCSPPPGSSRASTAPASNFSSLSLPSPETPATKKSSPRRSGDAGLRPSSPRKAAQGKVQDECGGNWCVSGAVSGPSREEARAPEFAKSCFVFEHR
ncbi:uncharacterized protein, partial [Sagmatias obliquidens]|uniref:uncharacterized protein n=1 Tax=Sagmatias obliquidens TaxID=3371155 RepID=UPI000F43F1AE